MSQRNVEPDEEQKPIAGTGNNDWPQGNTDLPNFFLSGKKEEMSCLYDTGFSKLHLLRLAKTMSQLFNFKQISSFNHSKLRTIVQINCTSTGLSL